tara:strand:- start:60 stop:593 length:534 start_codon:yes stop_codon:yes gene_type:complete
MGKKQKLALIISPILILFLYISTALYSVHQFHKGIYYNDKKLIKDYVEWDELRENFKNYINLQLLKKTKKSDEFKKLGEFGLLLSGLTGKFAETMVDTYLNPEGLSMFLKGSHKKKEIPKPSFITLIGGLIIIKFNGINSLYITYEKEGQEFPIFFNRKSLSWKITQIKLPQNLLSD